MKKKGSLKEHLVTALEVPRDLAYKEPIITITGKKSGGNRKLPKYPSLYKRRNRPSYPPGKSYHLRKMSADSLLYTMGNAGKRMYFPDHSGQVGGMEVWKGFYLSYPVMFLCPFTESSRNDF